MTSYDAIVVGVGQGGPYVASRLAGAGMKVAVIERNLIGGTCINTGCIPTKTMVASAYAARMAARAAEYGVDVGPFRVDMKRVKARKDAVSGQSRTGLEDWLQNMENCTVYRGHARFESAHEVRVGEERLQADKIFLNVGGRAFVPDMPGIREIDVLTNSSMMSVDFLPKRLIVVGGSYIGLEFAQMFRRFGAEVTILEMGPRLIAREDEDVSTAIREIVESEGVEVRLDARCIGFAKRGDEIIADVDCASGAPQVHGSHVLLAVGRRPNTDDLGLDEAGVAVDARGYVVVDDQLRTNVPGIWALGDCNGKGAFTHTAYNDGEIVIANLLENDPRRVSDRITAYALYVDPPLGRAGMTEEEIRKSGRKTLIGKRPMTRVGRAVEKGETQGFMKIAVDAETGAILGAAILGVGGDEVIHSILDVMYAKAPWTVIRGAMHIHPTVSELIPTMLSELRPMDTTAA
ncbi:FAD-containing oxidoreductase [Phenylobacterium sp. LjRoot225]|uniref:FAD-containing oxidoreductase n=1 Tax=Phenylobacterium sp. LjRoot225 TaxID=3342285 RepID=UPI003ECEB119